MIKNIKTSEIKKYLKENSKIVLLDVRTEDEWKNIGKPLSDTFMFLKCPLAIIEKNL